MVLQARGVLAFSGAEGHEVDLDGVFRVPPDLHKAQLHVECNRFGRRLEAGAAPTVVCDCCLNFKSPPYDLSTPTSQLDSSGSFIPTFFLLLDHLRVYFAVLAVLALVGVAFTVANNCKRGSSFQHCGLNLATLIDIRERETNDLVFDYVQYPLRYLPIICSVMMVLLFLKNNLVLRTSIQLEKLTAADYTVIVRDIAPENESKEYIENYLNCLMRENGKEPVEVMRVNICNSELPKKLLEQQIEMNEKQQQSFRKQLKCSAQNLKLTGSLNKLLASAEKEHTKLVRSLEEMKSKSQNDRYWTGVAFVSLKTTDQANAVLSLNTISSGSKKSFLPCFPCRNLKKPKHDISKAMDPTDVVWENICMSSQQLIFYERIKIVLIILCFLAAVFMQQKAIDLQMYLKANPSKHFFQAFGNQFEIELANILGSVMFTATNFLIKFAFSFIFSLSRNFSKTIQQQEIISANSIIMTLTVFYPITTYLKLPPTIDLTKIILYNEAVASFVDVLTVYFDPSTIFRSWRASRVKKQIETNSCFDVTQKDFNDLCTPPDLEIPLRYGLINRTTLIGSFVSYFSPLCVLVYSVYYMLLLPVLKKKLITNTLKPDALEASTNSRLLRMFIINTYIGITSRFFIRNHLELPFGSTGIFLLTELLASMLLLFGTGCFISYLESKTEPEIQEMLSSRSTLTDEQLLSADNLERVSSFDKVINTFEYDYERCNPISSKKAVQSWVQENKETENKL